MAEITLTSDNFKAEVLDSKVPVLVDFWATWCGPCQMMGPVVEELANESDGSYKVGKVNVDEQGDLAQQYGIMSIPAFFVFKDGKVSASTVGAQAKDSLLEMIKQ
ncbi:MAG: thioredoxin [Treponema sp.]|nr:thioredoxin [Treponema sp.]